MTTTPMSSLPGVWTPWADVLCVPCHSRALDLRHATACYDTHVPGGACDACGVEILLPPTVAPLAWLRRQVPGGQMAQTGGMCAALIFQRNGEDRLVIGAAVEDGEAVFSAGVYDSDHPFPGEAALDATARGLQDGLELVKRLLAQYVTD